MNLWSNERRFRPRGIGRFAVAAFLSVWLCGWAAGEAFVLYILVSGLMALLTGAPPRGWEQPLEIGPAPAVGAFLVVWLAFWTIGGIAAIRELLRLLWAEDRLAVEPDGLLVTRRLGPFVTRQKVARDEIRRVYVLLSTGALMAQVGTNTMKLTDLGTPSERAEAAEWLRSELRLTDEMPATGEALPEGWQELRDFRGDVIVVPDLRTRRQQAWIVTVIAALVWGVVFLLVRGSLRNDNLWVLTLMVGAFACWLAWQALWLHRGRKEWRIERGRLVHQRRFGWSVTELAEARALELTESRDGDGDYWYRLEAPLTDQPGKNPGRRVTVQQVLHDPTEPRGLGLYLARRAGISFRDLVPDDAARAAELAKLTDALAASGKFGRWAARYLTKRLR